MLHRSSANSERTPLNVALFTAAKAAGVDLTAKALVEWCGREISESTAYRIMTGKWNDDAAILAMLASSPIGQGVVEAICCPRTLNCDLNHDGRENRDDAGIALARSLKLLGEQIERHHATTRVQTDAEQIDSSALAQQVRDLLTVYERITSKTATRPQLRSTG